MTVADVPMIFAPVPQQITWQKVEAPNGDPGAQILVQMPMLTMILNLDRASGLKLADGLREIFGGLMIATELPPTNGQHP